MKKTTSWKSPILLFLAALIWGVAFVAQSVGMDYVGGFTFSCVRCLIGSAFLLPCIYMLDRWKEREQRKRGAADPSVKQTGAAAASYDGEKQKAAAETEKAQSRTLWIGGICCGLALSVAANLQQFGIKYTTVGKAGFITAMYIVLVPVVGIFLKKTKGIKIWFSVVLAVAGLYLLCMKEGFSIGFGDLLVMLSALAFTVHIMVIDHFSPLVDGVRMSCIQFLTCGILSGIGMFLFEQPHMDAILMAWQPILYAGVLSCGVAYTLQIVGQKEMNPTVASLIMSLESVISVLAGWVLLGQSLSLKELLGCLLMCGAIVLAQI